MNLPVSPPPTDGLYKFAATSGLLVVLALFVYITFQIDRIETESDALRADTPVIGAQIKALNSEGKYLEHFEEKDKTAFQARLRETEEKAALINAKIDSLKRRDERVKRLFWQGRFFGVIGLGLSVWGFRRWYQRLQKPQDDLLRAQVLAGLPAHREKENA